MEGYAGVTITNVSRDKTHKSLDEFCKKYSSRIGERILLYTKGYQKDEAVTYLPVYYAAYL